MRLVPRPSLHLPRRWFLSALADVEAIAGFITRDSDRNASVVVERMLEAAASLADLA
jgi:plasmid stabilization system protein ParE